VAALVAAGAPAGTAGAQELRLVVGDGSGGDADRLAGILAGPLGDALGRPVAATPVVGDDGLAAARAVAEAPADGNTVLLADNLRLALLARGDEAPLALDALRPLAKLTLGISVALVAPAGSELSGWSDLSEAAKQGALTLGVAEGAAAHEVAQALLEAASRAPFERRVASDPRAVAETVAAGRADLGIVTTHAVGDTAGLRPVLTFGAKRSPLFPETPTLAELTGSDKDDFTYSFAVFGPAGLPDDTAASLSAAVDQACGDPDLAVAARAARLPLACHDAEIVRQTLARDLGVVQRLAATRAAD
jgi:tripartite-type tricarboxylate transporter receptor subunit TctC